MCISEGHLYIFCQVNKHFGNQCQFFFEEEIKKEVNIEFGLQMFVLII